MKLVNGCKNDGKENPDEFNKELPYVPIHCKLTLTIREAAIYSNIGINKLELLLASPRCPFVLYIGRKKLIKRKEFEKFIQDRIEI